MYTIIKSVAQPFQFSQRRDNVINYKNFTLQSLIDFLQTTKINFEEYCSVDEGQASLPNAKAYFVSLWGVLPWSRSIVQKVLVKVSPGEYRAECSCTGPFGSKALCWHVALVLYREQYYLEYEKQLLLDAAGERLEVAEKLMRLRDKYFGSWWTHHMGEMVKRV